MVAKQLDSMATSHAGMGRIPEAIEAAEFAISLANESGHSEVGREIRARLSQYRARLQRPQVDFR